MPSDNIILLYAGQFQALVNPDRTGSLLYAAPGFCYFCFPGKGMPDPKSDAAKLLIAGDYSQAPGGKL